MNKKELYQYLKMKLKSRRKNIRYFNWGFFEGYVEWRKVLYNAECSKGETSDKLDKQADTIFNEKVASSGFYQKNGGCYCEFLELAAAEDNVINKFINENV